MKYFLVISLSLMVFGAISESYTQTYYNVIKDPSFEENSEFWEEHYKLVEPLGYASKHYKDTTAPDGDYVGLTSARTRPSVGVSLSQKFVPRIIKDFDLTPDEMWNFSFCWKWKTTEEDGGYKFGVTLKSKQGNTVKHIICLPWEGESSWGGSSLYVYDMWRRAGLPETDSLEEIVLWSQSYYDYKQNKRYGQEVRWDNIQLLSSRFDIDGAVLSIDSPTKIAFGQTYIPKATIKNCGALEMEGVTAACEIAQHHMASISWPYHDTVACYCLLKPDSTIQLQFKEFIPREPADCFVITISSLLENDQNSDNDTKTQTLTGILEKKTNETKIKTLPSIFSRQAIMFLPKGNKVRIYNPNGKLVKELYDSDRDGKVLLGKDLPKGIYFYETAGRKGKFIKIKNGN